METFIKKAATLLVGACVLMSCQQSGTTDLHADIAAITAMSNDRAKAFNDGNAAGIAVHFTKDACLMAPESELQRGVEGVQVYYQTILGEFYSELESGYEEVKVDGDLAYGRGFAKVILTPKPGGEKLISTAKSLNK